jgi:hypothetical protein
LLVSKIESYVASIEDQIAHKTPRSVIHEDASLLVIWVFWRHVENKVLQLSSLSDLPVYPRVERIRGHLCEIENQIPDLAVEIVLASVNL